MWSEDTITTEPVAVITACGRLGSKLAPLAGGVELHLCEGETCVTAVMGWRTRTPTHGPGQYARVWCATNEHLEIEMSRL